MNTTANIALAVVLTAQHAFATEAVLTGPYRPHPAEIFANEVALRPSGIRYCEGST